LGHLRWLGDHHHRCSRVSDDRLVGCLIEQGRELAACGFPRRRLCAGSFRLCGGGYQGGGGYGHATIHETTSRTHDGCEQE
jgi:hypothetical protein